jgi:hypothetical protein
VAADTAAVALLRAGVALLRAAVALLRAGVAQRCYHPKQAEFGIGSAAIPPSPGMPRFDSSLPPYLRPRSVDAVVIARGSC